MKFVNGILMSPYQSPFQCFELFQQIIVIGFRLNSKQHYSSLSQQHPQMIRAIDKKLLSLTKTLQKNQIIYQKDNNKAIQSTNQKKSEKIELSYSRIYFSPNDLIKISTKRIHELKQFTFIADLGHFFRHPGIPGLHLKRVKKQDIGAIFKISEPHLQFNQASKLVKGEFMNVKNLSTKINKKSLPLYQNIPINYFLDYYAIRFEIMYGLFLFHQPIQMTLDEAIQQNNFTYNQKLDLIDEILNIVKFLHQLNICHRNINPYNLVFVSKENKHPTSFYYQKINSDYKKNWRYDKGKHMLKICGFYQATYVHEGVENNPNYPSILFQNIYIDPNIYKYDKPQFASDLWSVLIIMYQIFTGKVPHLNNKEDMEINMDKIHDWQKKFFQCYFKGTQKVNFRLKDFQLLIKNMKMTSDICEKISKEQKQRQIILQNSQFSFREKRKSQFRNTFRI